MSRIVPTEKQILIVCPDLYKEWDFEKNEKAPQFYSYGSGKEVYWKCKRCGHSWPAKIFHRKNGSGCPKCAHGKRTSLPEQVFYYYIKQCFADALNGYKPEWLHRMSEIDIYIPSLKLGIEYDGGNWHKHLDKDIEKTKIIMSHGINLIRIRDKKCMDIQDNSMHIELGEEDVECLFLKPGLDTLFQYICATYQVNIDLDIDIRRDLLKIMAFFAENKKNNSLAMRYPNVALEWNYDANGGLLPEQVSYGSKIPVHWKCSKESCGNTWSCSVKNRTISGSGCPRCGSIITQEKRRQTFLRGGLNTLAMNSSELTIEWDYDRNGDVVPEEINIGSTKNFYWDCVKNHYYRATISARLRGRGCPYCAGRKVWIGFNDIGSVDKKLLNAWDYEKNNTITPYTYSKGSHKKVYWICLSCGESFIREIRLRVEGNGYCKKCAIKQGTKKRKDMALQEGKNTLSSMRPDLVLDWNWKKNGELKPDEISVGSNTKVFWECRKCGYQWPTRVFERGTQNRKCGVCSNRVLWEGHNDLLALHPEIAIDWDEIKNGVPASKIFPGNKKKESWWKCHLCNEVWQAAVRDRVKGRKKCPKCSLRGEG